MLAKKSDINIQFFLIIYEYKSIYLQAKNINYSIFLVKFKIELNSISTASSEASHT